ncbi:hypothetical protein LIER_06837 [Lithospermum erythrorhizon]|uniref:Uncharacterized protein n=1 Tax=Lithospermum erythrorhizon TaxID=34254 RepID=A0AAV3P5U7_LITER
MSTAMLPIKPAGVRACATTTSHRKAEVSKGKVSTSKWWGPVFGWSTEPDYIVDTEENKKNNIDPDPKTAMFGSGSVSSKPRFAPGAFTEEKARQLRIMTTETTAFHDAMYHSSIATKLASDFSKY